MVVLIRKCKSCGMGIDISEKDHITIADERETMYFCRECMFKNYTFQELARQYVMQESQEKLGGQ